jgi:hypothetical protein
MFPGNVNSIYCPGCAPGNVLQPHICGSQRPSPVIPSWLTSPRPCEHCFCQSLMVMGTDHETCCMCFTRRAKATKEG